MTAPESASSFAEFGNEGEYGLAVAAWGDWSIRPVPLPSISGEVVGGIQVNGPTSFRLVAVWACLSGKPTVNPVTEALEAWTDWLSTPPLVVAGDFNTGGWWQKITKGPMSHFPIVDDLTKRGLHSAYHAARGTEQGVEEEVTHWHSRGGTYMIDHVFIPTDWTINEVEVGPEDPWRERSDHAPIVVDVGDHRKSRSVISESRGPGVVLLPVG